MEPQYYDRIGGGKDQLGFIAPGREAGREPVQDHERGGGAAGPRLPEALGGPVGRGEVPAEAGGKVGEETG